MIRFIVRLVALLALAAGFAMLVIDGTQSIAANRLIMTPIGETCATVFPAQFAALQPMAMKANPYLWDPVLKSFFGLWTWLVLTVFGMILFWLARPRRPKIGYSSRP